MALTREEVRIQLGIDSTTLHRGLRSASQQVEKFGDETGKQFLKIGKAITAAFAFREAIAALRDVSAELDKLYDKIDARRYLDEQRRQQLKSLSPDDQENILAGSAQLESVSGSFKNFLAKGAGLYGFAGGTIANFVKNFSHQRGIFDQLGQAAAKAAERQREIVDGMKDAARAAEAEKKAKEEADAKLKARAALEDRLAKAEKENAEKNRKYHEAELKMRNDINAAINKSVQTAAALRQKYADLLRSQSDVSLADAFAATDRARGDLELPELRFSAKQMDALDKARILQRQAQQARIDGNAGLADQLSSERAGLLKSMGYLSAGEGDIFGDLRKQAIENNKNMRDLLTLAQQNGIQVVIKDVTV